MKKVLFIFVSLIFTINLFAQNCKLSSKAQEYWDRAVAASEMIKSDDDYQLVVDEFEIALEYAPNCSDIYYNLAKIYYQISLKQEGMSALNKAEKHIKSYMKMETNDKEAQSLLRKIAYGQERQEKDKEKNEMKDGVLINGIRWAACNVAASGTFAARPEDAGMPYQWNRYVSGWDRNDGNRPPATNNATWEKANDPCPAGWRVPTENEIRNLLKVESEWITVNGVTGRRFTDKVTGNSIFLPAAGSRNSNNGILEERGSKGRYWSSTRESILNVCGMSFDSYYAMGSILSYWEGQFIRCVAE